MFQKNEKRFENSGQREIAEHTLIHPHDMSIIAHVAKYQKPICIHISDGLVVHEHEPRTFENDDQFARCSLHHLFSQSALRDVTFFTTSMKLLYYFAEGAIVESSSETRHDKGGNNTSRTLFGASCPIKADHLRLHASAMFGCNNFNSSYPRPVSWCKSLNKSFPGGRRIVVCVRGNCCFCVPAFVWIFCGNRRRSAKACRQKQSRLSVFPPYLLSPTSGCPMLAQLTRIWCVKPSRMLQATNV